MLKLFACIMRRHHAARLAVLSAVVAVCTAACSGGSNSKASVEAPPSVTSTTAGAGANRAALQSFIACLKQHGVTVSTPTTSPGQTFPTPPAGGNAPPGGQAGGQGRAGLGGIGAILNDPADKAAVQACQIMLPTGFLQQQQQGQTQLVAFQSCMKDHGVSVTGSGFTPQSSSETTTPAYAAAFTVCKALLPSGGSFGSPPSATPSSS